MKAVKLYKIVWDLDALEPAERAKVQKELPTAKGFTCDDKFEVADKVPSLLRKKFGYDIKTFSYSEINIAEDLDSLLSIVAPKDVKRGIFRPNGKLSSRGQEALANLEEKIHERKKMEFRGARAEEMPTILDEIMLGVEHVLGIDWDEEDEETILQLIAKKVKEATPVDYFKKHKLGDEEEDEEMEEE